MNSSQNFDFTSAVLASLLGLAGGEQTALLARQTNTTLHATAAVRVVPAVWSQLASQTLPMGCLRTEAGFHV